MLIWSQIRKLRIISFLLFFTPVLSLIGSLAAHNYLVSFKFDYEFKYNFKKNVPGEILKKLCTEENSICKLKYDEGTHNLFNRERSKKLNECNKYKLDYKYLLENEKSFFQITITDQLNKNCILNTSSITYYNIAPFIFEKTHSLIRHKKTSIGTSETVNPFFYGETSISNIVKRFPVKFFFKPLMYLGVFFMICYWMYYNSILNTLFKKKGKNTFLIFGILSAIFLLLHVFFLGWTFENEILTKLRRSLIVFFILSVIISAYIIDFPLMFLAALPTVWIKDL